MKNREASFTAGDAPTQPGNGLTPNSVLRRLPELKLRITSNNELRISLPGKEIACGIHGLTILDLFSKPISIHDAVEQLSLRVSGGQDCVDQWQTILQLYKVGVLQDENCVEPALPIEPDGFDSLDIHARMLNDHARTARYLAAIKETVQPGDIVIDIGTGTGILAMTAARAGARQVYAVEAGQVGQTAKDLFSANKLSERITLLPGWSTQINLPEKADVMISEIIGNDPLGERVLEVTADAKRRLLKPGARLLPQTLEVYGLAVDVPDSEIKDYIITANTLCNWSHWYDFDFSSLSKAAMQQSAVFYRRPHKIRHWPVLSEPLQLAKVNFQSEVPQVIDQDIRFTIATAGRFNGLMIYFNLGLSEANQITTSPLTTPRECHWRNQILILPEAFQPGVGDEFVLTYRHGIAGKERITVVRA